MYILMTTNCYTQGVVVYGKKVYGVKIVQKRFRRFKRFQEKVCRFKIY